MTEKLFYEDAYIQSFTAVVKTCVEKDGKYEVTLDRTAFYPLGGGQPADKGTLGGQAVLDVRTRDGEVVHTLAAPLAENSEVYGEIDWPHRFSLMQHHTGEHIVSGLAFQLHGCNNVGFHMGHDAVTIDLDKKLGWGQLLEIERKANEAVYADLPVEISCPDADALSQMRYRSKIELHGDVRIVTVPGYDVCACCGTHARTTGEIGVVKLLDSQRYKGGLRVWLLCGSRALEDYEQKNSALSQIAASFSVKLPEAAAAVARQQQELSRVKMENNRLQDEVFRLKAQVFPEGAPFALCFEQALSPDALRRFALALCGRCKWAAVLSADGGGWKYALAGGAGQDVRAVSRELNNAFSGRGGGKPELAQGSLTCGTAEQVRELLERFA